MLSLAFRLRRFLCTAPKPAPSPQVFYPQFIHSCFLPQALFTAVDLRLPDLLQDSMSVADLAKAAGTVLPYTE